MKHFSVVISIVQIVELRWVYIPRARSKYSIELIALMASNLQIYICANIHYSFNMKWNRSHIELQTAMYISKSIIIHFYTFSHQVHAHWSNYMYSKLLNASSRVNQRREWYLYGRLLIMQTQLSEQTMQITRISIQGSVRLCSLLHNCYLKIVASLSSLSLCC